MMLISSTNMKEQKEFKESKKEECEKGNKNHHQENRQREKCIGTEKTEFLCKELEDCLKECTIRTDQDTNIIIPTG